MPESNKVNQRVKKTVYETAQKVGALINLLDVRLVYQDVRLGNLKSCQAEVSVGHGCATRRDIENKQIRIDANFQFELREKDQQGGEPMAFIRAVFALCYYIESVETVSDEEAQAFGSTSGSVTAWPYWREMLYSTMARMGLQPITLPSFRVAADSDEPTVESTATQQPA
jgi:hypothetical protein